MSDRNAMLTYFKWFLSCLGPYLTSARGVKNTDIVGIYIGNLFVKEIFVINISIIGIYINIGVKLFSIN